MNNNGDMIKLIFTTHSICKYDLYVAVVVTFSTISWEHDVVRIQFTICTEKCIQYVIVYSFHT